MTTPPIWLRTTINTVEVVVAILLLVLCAVLLNESLRLGAGWSTHGPNAGFFPLVLTILAIIGTLGVLYTAYRAPDRRPFFEVNQEIVDLLKVGLPIFGAVLLIRWLGIYATAGVYLAFFMAYYGKFRWYSVLAGGILLPAAMWFLLFRFFNIPMPMSMFYRQGILPF
jgi:putative tricarboxylic transport membrane protein